MKWWSNRKLEELENPNGVSERCRTSDKCYKSQKVFTTEIQQFKWTMTGHLTKVDKLSLPVILRRNDFSDSFHSDTCFSQPHLDTDDGKN